MQDEAIFQLRPVACLATVRSSDGLSEAYPAVAPMALLSLLLSHACCVILAARCTPFGATAGYASLRPSLLRSVARRTTGEELVTENYLHGKQNLFEKSVIICVNLWKKIITPPSQPSGSSVRQASLDRAAGFLALACFSNSYAAWQSSR